MSSNSQKGHSDLDSEIPVSVVASGIIFFMFLIGVFASLNNFAYVLYLPIFYAGAGLSIIALMFSIIIYYIGKPKKIEVYCKDQRIDEPVVASQPLSKGAGISQIQCGVCGTMNDIDAIYCKKCANHFR